MHLRRTGRRVRFEEHLAAHPADVARDTDRSVADRDAVRRALVTLVGRLIRRP
jgi:hypothetical protein